MAARELKALIEVGTSLGYSVDELKQFINDERMRQDREKENERAEEERVEKPKQTKEKEERELQRAEREKEIERVEREKELQCAERDKERAEREKNRIGLNERRKGKEILSLKGLDLRKKSKCSEYVQSMNLKLQK